MVNLSKNIANKEFIFGDFDKDGTPNIDDKKPFNPKNNLYSQEVSLADELNKIKRHNREYKQFIDKVINHYKKRYKVTYRIKRTNSTIGKLRRKFIGEIYDIGAVTIIGKDYRNLLKIKNDISRHFRVIRYKNYYKTGKEGDAYYNAIHLVVRVSSTPIEIQLKTKGNYLLHRKTHPLYKTYKKPSKKEYARLLEKAKKISAKES